ncbi:uncharacterized protein LOC102445062 [Pelodiscus sinensis]|uniref:uncharacterized protein LOC102445062 n=1 Tax=Pelodiscus sinensis TaxID=13735 RepID=UPI003F6BF2CE
MGDFPALLLLLALAGPGLARAERELVTAGSSFRTTCYYDKHSYSQHEKFWCKEQSDGKCLYRVLTQPARGRNIASTGRLNLRDLGMGWISVSMTELQVEDSGTYWCGVSNPRKDIPLKKVEVVVSYEAPVKLSAKKGDSVFLNCSYSVTDNWKLKNFTWCKMVAATMCQPVINVEFIQGDHTQGRTKIKIDRWHRLITVTLVELQLRDSGEYHCEAHFLESTVLMKMITLNVLDTVNEANEGGTAPPTVASNKEQRTLYIVLALGCFLAGSALIATISLVAIIFNKGRKKGQALNFGEPPNCRLAAQQDKGHPRDVTPEGGLKNGLLYAMLRLQPKPTPDDVTYANVELPPKPEGAISSAEPAAVLFSSGTMEYATIIFRDSAGPQEKQTGPHPT